MARSPFGNYGYAILTAGALRTPDKVALTYCGETSLTYDGLNRKVNRVAHALLEAGIGPGQRVASLMNETLNVAEVYLAQMKLGFPALVGPAFYAGMRLVLEQDWGPANFLKVVPRERVTHVSLIPSFFSALLGSDDHADVDLSSLSAIVLGGEPLLPSLRERIMKRLPGAAIFSYYGQTEAPYTCIGRQDDGSQDISSVGRARASTAVRVTGPGSGVAVECYLVEEQAPSGVEVIVGAVRDPSFGPVLLVGLGGVWTEVLRDTAMRLCPITEDDARRMLSELRGAALLDGFRGSPAVDRDALVEVLLAVGGPGGVVESLGEGFTEFELNPVICTPEGAVAVDARLLHPSPADVTRANLPRRTSTGCSCRAAWRSWAPPPSGRTSATCSSASTARRATRVVSSPFIRRRTRSTGCPACRPWRGPTWTTPWWRSPPSAARMSCARPAASPSCR